MDKIILEARSADITTLETKINGLFQSCEYNKVSALKLHEYYGNGEYDKIILSSIRLLSNLSFETYYGTAYILKLLERCEDKINPIFYRRLLDNQLEIQKIENKMTPEQRDITDKLTSFVATKVSGLKTFLDKYKNDIYTDYCNMNILFVDGDVIKDLNSLYDYIKSESTTSVSALYKYLYIALLHVPYEIVDLFESSDDDFIIVLSSTLKDLYKDEVIRNIIKNIPNFRIRTIITSLCTGDYENNIVAENTKIITESDMNIATPYDMVHRFDRNLEFDFMQMESKMDVRTSNLNNTKNIFESMITSRIITESYNDEDIENIISEITIVEDKIMEGYDGRINKVLAHSLGAIAKYGEEDDDVKAVQKLKKEEDRLKLEVEKEELKDKIKNKKSSPKGTVSEEDIDKLLDESTDTFEENMILNKSISVSNTDGSKKDDKDTDTSDNKPVKKSSGNRLNKMSNKAIDADVKYQKAKASGKKIKDDVANVAKAGTKIPAGVLNTVKSAINELDNMDDNKRKDYMLKPGFRKKYWKVLRLAITHGLFFAINPILNIITIIATKISNKKDERIRTEFINELEAEIEICEKKIEDASMESNKSDKYKLMRVRKRLQQQLLRVKFNSEKI
jgi:hypothetical protein